MTATAKYSCPSGYSPAANNTCYQAAYTTTHPAYITVPVNGGCAYNPGFGIGPNATLVSASSLGLSSANYPKGVCKVPAQTVTTPASSIAATAAYSCPNGYTLATANCNINMSPKSLVASVSAKGQVNLSWDNNSVPGIVSINIERASGASASFVQIGSVGPGVTTYVDSGLAPSTAYQYRISMTVNVFGNSNSVGPYTSTVTATTVPKPSTPSLSITGILGTSMTLAMSDADSDITAYNFYESSPQGILLNSSATSKTYAVSNLLPSTKYCFTASAAVNPVNVSSMSTAMCATTLAAPVFSRIASPGSPHSSGSSNQIGSAAAGSTNDTDCAGSPDHSCDARRAGGTHRSRRGIGILLSVDCTADTRVYLSLRIHIECLESYL